MSLSVAQSKAARALLGWSATDLARAAKLGIATVKRFDSGQTVSAASIDQIKAALEAAGISFIPEGGTSETGGLGVRLV